MSKCTSLKGFDNSRLPSTVYAENAQYNPPENQLFTIENRSWVIRSRGWWSTLRPMLTTIHYYMMLLLPSRFGHYGGCMQTTAYLFLFQGIIRVRRLKPPTQLPILRLRHCHCVGRRLFLQGWTTCFRSCTDDLPARNVPQMANLVE